MRVALNEDWVHLVVPDCPKRLGTILLPDETIGAFENRAIGLVVAAGPQVPAHVKAGVKVWYNENKHLVLAAYTRKNQIACRWRDCVGVVEADPIPTPEEWSNAEQYVSEAEKAAETRRADRASKAARKLITAPGGLAAVAGAAPGLVTGAK